VQFDRGKNMLSIDKIELLFMQHNNILTTAELSANKIYYTDIQKLLSDGMIEKIKRGYYLWVDQYNASEVGIINSLFPDAVLCMDTALFYYRYSDRTPCEWHLAFDKNVSKQRLQIDYPFIKTYRLESRILPIGITKGTIDFISVRIYDRDRIICDCLRYMNKMDKETFNKAIQHYVNDPRKNIPNLMQYAKELRVQKKVKDLIGVWL